MLRFIIILLVVIITGCISKSRDEIIDFKGVSPNEGVKYLNRIEEKSRNNPDIFYKRAALYFEMEQYDKALLDIDRSLEIEEANADYIYLAGQVSQKLGQSERAIEQLLLAEGLGLHNHLLYQALAEEYLKLDKTEEAKLAIERLIGLNKSSGNYALAGQISLNLGDTLSAEKYYKESLNQGINTTSLSALSDIYNFKKQPEIAGEYINRSLAVKPNNVPDLYRKAKILTKINETDSARKVYKQIILLDSSQAVFHFKLGQTYYDSFEYDSAQIFAEKSLVIDEQFIDGRMLLARCQEKKNNYNEAQSSYNAILAQDSTFNLAREELDNLQRKVAYLRRLDQQRRALDSARNNAPVLIDRKGINN